MKKIAVLGSTGSIGTQTLDIVRNNSDELQIVALAAGSNVELMEKQVREFSPKLVAMWTPEAAKELKDRISDLPTKVLSGMEGLLEIAVLEEVHVLVTAIVGMIGIRPTIAAIQAGKDIALANKETLVCAGHIIMPLAKACGVSILPVDSEHSAIFQSMNGEPRNRISKILLTASGGPFRGWTREQMKHVKLEDALKQTGARLLILDPIQAYLGGGMDMNRANEARDMTKKLGALAEKYKCAIVLIGHMNKAAGNKAAYRGMGSIDFFAVARSVLLVGRVEGQPNTRAVVQIKNNLAAFGHPKAFRLSENGFEWQGDYEITADEVLGGIAPKANKLEQAKHLLLELAVESKVISSAAIIELAKDHGISKRTLESAKKELNIPAKRINNIWYWDCSKIE